MATRHTPLGAAMGLHVEITSRGEATSLRHATLFLTWCGALARRSEHSVEVGLGQHVAGDRRQDAIGRDTGG